MSVLPGLPGQMRLRVCFPVPFVWPEGQSPQVAWLGVEGLPCCRKELLGGSRVRKLRYNSADPAHASEVHLYRDASISPLLTLRSRLLTVQGLLLSFSNGGFTVGRALHLNEVWGSIVLGRGGGR